MFRSGVPSRVSKLEETVGGLSSTVTAMGEDMKEVRESVGGLSGEIKKLVEGLSVTGERAAQRAYAVRDEMRGEHDRKARERSSLMRDGLALLGGVALIVTALVGPYRERLSTTAQGQQADTAAIGAVREVLAQQGSATGDLIKDQDALRREDMARDDRLRDIDQRIAHMEGRFGVNAR